MAIQTFDKITTPNLGPLLIYGFLFFSIGYTIYHSAPRYGMKKIKGIITSQVCTGNSAPYGCKVDIEIQQNNQPRAISFTGSFQKMYDTFQEVEFWSNPDDTNDFMLERSWSKDGLTMINILVVLLLVYSIYRFVNKTLMK